MLQWFFFKFLLFEKFTNYFLGKSAVYLNQKEIFQLLVNEKDIIQLKVNKEINSLSIFIENDFIELETLFSHIQYQYEMDRIISIFDLFAAICNSRNIKFCLHFIEFFPYNILIDYLKKTNLPFDLRASFCRLILVLYLDKEPHCYKTRPNLIYKFSHEKRDTRIGATQKFMNMIKNISPSFSPIPLGFN